MKTELLEYFVPSRRTICCVGLGAFFISACEAKPVKTRINISFFSYVNRPIFDVYMNGTDFGMAPAQGFYGSNSVMVAQVITLGPQKVTWRLDGPKGMARNGETVTAKNTPEIKEIPPGVKWLALHIYEDDTVEIAFSKGSPDELSTARGKKIIEAAERKNGK
jgi:hypothetical protein